MCAGLPLRPSRSRPERSGRTSRAEIRRGRLDSRLSEFDVVLADVEADESSPQFHCGEGRCAGADEGVKYDVARLGCQRDASAGKRQREFGAVAVALAGGVDAVISWL